MPTWSRPPKFFVPVDVVQSSLGPWFDRNHGAHGALHPIQRGAFEQTVITEWQRRASDKVARFSTSRSAMRSTCGGRIAHPR
jgi:hypothetical protein